MVEMLPSSELQSAAIERCEALFERAHNEVLTQAAMCARTRIHKFESSSVSDKDNGSNSKGTNGASRI